VTQIAEAYVDVRANTTQFRDQVNKDVVDPLKQVGKEAEKAEKASGGSFRKLSDSLTQTGKKMTDFGKSWSLKVTAPIVGLGTAAVMAAGNFEQSMNKVRAITGATDDQMKAMSDQAKELGRTTRFSASEAADAMSFLGMAGFKTEQIIGAMPKTLQLAAAANMDLASAADITSNILSGYGLEVSELGSANDALVKTMTRTNVDLRMLGDSFKFVGPVAKGAGVDFNQTAAAIGLLGNAGIQGSMAGTSLRQVIAALVKPTGTAKAAMDELGLTATDSAGRLLPLDQIIRQLEPHAENTGAMMTIFGSRAGPAMMALVSQGADALTNLTQELVDAGGTAERIAGIQMEGFNGKMTEMKSAIEGLLIAIGESGLLDFMTSFVGSITGIIQKLASANPAVLKFVTIIGGSLAIIGPVVLIIGKLMTSIGALIAIAIKAGAAIKAFFTAVSVGHPILLALTVAIGAAVAVFTVWNGKKKEAAERTKAFADAIRDERMGVEGATGALISNSLAADKTQSAIKSLGLTNADVTRAIMGESVPAYDALRAEYDRVMSNGMSLDQQMRQLEATFGGNIGAARQLFAEVDKLAKGYDEGTAEANRYRDITAEVNAIVSLANVTAADYAFILGDVSTATAEVTDMFGEQEEATEDAAKALEDFTKRSMDAAKAQFDWLTATRSAMQSGAKSVAEFQVDAKTSIDEYNKQLRENIERIGRWKDNLLRIMRETSPEFAAELASMGMSGVELVDSLARSGDDLQATFRTWLGYSAVMSRDVTDEFRNTAEGAAHELQRLDALTGQIFADLIQQAGIDAKMIGWASVTGVADSMGEGIPQLQSKAREMAREMLDAAKQELGIRSPSAVFASEVGEPIGFGVAEGISRTVIETKDAIFALIDDLTYEALQGVDRFNDAMQDVLKSAQAAYDEVWNTIQGRRSQEQTTKRVTDAEDALADANDRVTDATQAVSDAAAELLRLRASGEATAKDLTAAERNLERAQKDLDRAQKDVQRSTKSLEDANLALLKASEYLLEQGPESVKNFENIARAAGLEKTEIDQLVRRYLDLATARREAAEAARLAGEVDREIARGTQRSASQAANEAVVAAVQERERIAAAGKDPGAATQRAANAAIAAAQAFAQETGAAAGSRAFAQKQLDVLRFLVQGTPWLGGPLKGVMDALARQIGLANGAIVAGPRLAVVGERGAEAVVPLTRPSRAMQLLEQSGLADMVRANSDSSPLVNIQSATFMDGTDADLVAQKVNAAYASRVVLA